MFKILAITLIIIIIFAILVWQAQSNWTKNASTFSQKITSDSFKKAEYVNLAEVSGLPEPVKRYFHLVLQDGAPIINAAYVTQSGGFRAKPEMQEYSNMQAEQYFSSRPRAFVWNAKISMLPGIAINVLDSYIEGKGGMKVKMLSLFNIIDAQNQNELNEGALQRFLAEAVWFPTALLPSQGVVWTELDKNKAKATITDVNITTSLEFTFNEKGEIISAYTPARYKEVDGKYEPTPWRAKYLNYIDINGYLVPSYGEVEWHLKDKIYSYWRADVVEIKYK